MMNLFLHFKDKELSKAYQKEVDIQNGAVFRLIKWFVIFVVIVEYAFKIYQRIRDHQASYLALDFILVIAVIGGYLFALFIKRKTRRLDRYIDAIYLILYCYGSFYITYDLFKTYDSSSGNSQYENVIMGLQSVWIQLFFFTVMKNWNYKVLLVVANILILSLRTINTGEGISAEMYLRGAVSAIYTILLLYINEKIKKVVFIESLWSKNNNATFENILKNIPETIVMLNLDLTVALKNNLNKFFQAAEVNARRRPTIGTSRSLYTSGKKEADDIKSPMYEGKNFAMKLVRMNRAKLRDPEQHFRFLQTLFPHDVGESLIIHGGEDLRPENLVIRDYSLLEILEAISKDIQKFKKFLDESPDGNFLEMDMKYTPENTAAEERSVELKISIANFSSISMKIAGSEKIVLILRDTTQRDVIARLEDNNSYKDALLASVSHELRTPLNTNINSLESILADQQISQSTKLNFVVPAIRNAKLLLYIINDIMDLSQIASNRIKLVFAPTSLKETIIGCLDLVMYQALRKNLSIDWKIDPKVPDILCTDHTRLSQIILNLLKNAVKFTFTHKGVIKLRVEPDEDSILISIEDTGIGLNEENKEKMRNMFSKMDASERIAVRSTGAGLGLNVSNILAKMLGPSSRSGLMVESESDKGSMFKFLVEEKPKGTVSLRNTNGMSTLNFVLGDEVITQTGKEQFNVPGLKEIKLIKSNQYVSDRDFSKQVLENHDLNDSTAHIGQDAELEANLFDPAKFDRYTMSDKMKQSLMKFTQPMTSHKHITLEIDKPSDVKDKTRETPKGSMEQTPNTTALGTECKCCEVMVVDDEPFNVLTLEQLLGKWKKNCVTAFNGQEALKKIKDREGCSCEPGDEKCRWVQLIMMDKNMPVMDGIETTKEIRKMIERGEISRKFIVGNTAYVGEKEIDDFKKSGADEILLKPLDKSKIGGLLAKYIPDKCDFCFFIELKIHESLLKKSSVTYYKSLTSVACYRATEVHKKDHHHDKHDAHHHEEGSHHHEHHEDPNKPFYPGDITPKAYDEYNFIWQVPTGKENPYALFNVIANNSIAKRKDFLKFLYDNLPSGKTEDTSDYFRPPKIHENSVFLYQSREFANASRLLRGTDYLQLFAAVGFLKAPTLAIPIYALYYLLIGKAAVYERSNRFVTRLDFLPHLEMVHFQKVTAFGEVYSKLVRTQDLEYVEFADLEEENWFWGFNGSFDKLLIFRDKNTKEIFLFDRDGYWDVNGLQHELLN